MKFFVDTANLADISKLADMGLMDGVTTNPSLVARENKDFKDLIAEICQVTSGPVSAEVSSSTFDEMAAEADVLAQIAPNVVVKLPLTLDGLRVCKLLTNKDIRTNVTLCFTANQALLAAKAGATYVSPFIGRLDDLNLDGMSLIADIRKIYDTYEFDTQILAASIRSVNHVSEAALIGADCVTAPPKVIESLVEHTLTEKGMRQFEADWLKSGQTIL